MKDAKYTILLFCIAAVSWFVSLVVNPSGFELVFLVLCSAFTIIFFGSLFIRMAARAAKRRGRSICAYRVFAIVDAAIGLFAAAFAVWDIRAGEGWFAGLTGTLLLVFVEPVVLVLLAGDYVIWRVREKRQR